MPDSIASIVNLIHPTASGLGILTTDQVWIIFDREIDETSVAGGNFFISGPDFDTWSGPDLLLYLDAESLGDESEILESPGFHGLLQGEITFERFALTTLDTVETQDTTGSGHLFRTKAIFTPTNRLAANIEYTTYLSGDESNADLLKTGITSRTVYDVVASGTNESTGVVTFEGGYIGTVPQDLYRIEITTSGEVGTARFQFTRDSDPLSVFGPFKTKQAGVLLSDGVTVDFTDGDYVPGDTWYAIVKEPVLFSGNMSWPFKTGSGSIQTIPTTTATSVIGDPAPVVTTTTTSTTALSILSTVPVDETSHLTLEAGSFEITATFNKDIDPATIVSGVSVTVFSEPTTGDPSVAASGLLVALPTASGQVLTIDVAAGQLKQNNLVTVTLDSTIQDTDGLTLGTDYEFWFTTQYSPMYCTRRVVNLKIGAFISNVKDDTVNMALHVASLSADLMTWNKNNLDDDYYQFVRSQWTCCNATLMLLSNTVGATGAIKSKKLGDLAVEYNTNVDVSRPMDMAERCMIKWESALMAGGRQVQKPTGVVKGDLDLDRPPIGRGWVHNRDIHNNQLPAANRRVMLRGSRRYRNLHTRATYPKGWWDR